MSDVLMGWLGAENLERRERKRLYIPQNHYINRTRQVRLSCVKPLVKKHHTQGVLHNFYLSTVNSKTS